ncbi:lipid-binding protein [Solitalea lacus]|uniref:lipid-binding protein n=1 Tax=Solitalea lacus TaxID=2911172 RepID=UPI001EDA5941|nr:lipid-binding protein [Solitalea lacus]UKJ07693.1 hypothetical protein L2B55_00675 [Solitalea lacus]
MNIKKTIYIFLAVVTLGATACETLPEPEVKYSPVWPIAGEWKVKIKDEAVGTSSGLTILRTYNTSANSTDSVWVRVGTSQGYALLGKSACNVTAKTFSVQNGINVANANSDKFSVLEGKVLPGMAKVPSESVTDSVYMRYQVTSKAGITKVYIATGYRRTGFSEDE